MPGSYYNKPLGTNNNPYILFLLILNHIKRLDKWITNNKKSFTILKSNFRQNIPSPHTPNTTSYV